MKERNIRLLYIHEAFFQFSDTLLVIAIPIFLYQMFGSLSVPYAFVLSWNLVYGLCFIPLFNLAMKWKCPKYFMAMGIFIYMISLLIFMKVDTDTLWPLIPGTFLFGLYVAFYWMIRHWFISVNMDSSKAGRLISTLSIIRIIVNFLSPLVAGFVSFFVSFSATFLLGAIAGILSIVPIFLFKTTPHPTTYNFEKIKNVLNKRSLKAIRPAYFWEGFSLNWVYRAWILAFAIYVGTIMDLGILLAVTTLVAAVLTGQAGHWFDGRKRKKMLKILTQFRTIGGFLFATIYVVPSIVYIWSIDIFNRFIISMHQTVVDSYLFAFSSKIHPIHFHLNRELFLVIGRLTGNSILIITFLFAPTEFIWAIMALGSITLLTWRRLIRVDHLLQENSKL